MRQWHGRIPRPDRPRPGFSLVEVVTATMILGVVMVAALNSLGAFIRGQQQLGDRSRGWLLAQDLLAEIMQQEYEERVLDDGGASTATFGRESGESDSLRQNYDDVDDYHTWSASPPEDKYGNVDTNLNGWTRTVAIELVAPDDPEVTVGTDQGVKRITVTIHRDGKQVARMVALRSLAGPQPPFD
jgi:prepilin-type N-terminal cleavage/methylation domain-containing protein